MQHTLYTLLTNPKTRTTHGIKRALDQEFLRVGAPWFNVISWGISGKRLDLLSK